MDLEDVKQTIEDRMRKARFCIIGTIESYDSTTRTANVRPDIDEKYADGTTVQAPVITGVPIVQPSTASAGLALPVGSGDRVLLLHADRSIDRWMATGNRGAPGDTRMHAMTDGIGIVGVFPRTVSHSDGAGLLVYNGTIKVRLNSGKVAIGTSAVEVLDEVTKALDDIVTGLALVPYTATITQAASTALKTIKGSI